MDYKKKNVLTDKHDRAIPQFFDEIAKVFKPQPKIATEETAQMILSTMGGAKAKRNTIEPPHLQNVEILKGAPVTFVNWFHNGLFYGSKSRSIYTSPDAKTWTLLHTLPDIPSTIEIIIVSDTNRIIVACNNGEVFVSDEEGVFPASPTFVSGNYHFKFGQLKYGNIIGLNTYNIPHGFDSGQLHEVYISTDNGENFKKIFDNSTFATLPALADNQVHLHDIEYDPYSGRLYLWVGDLSNRTMHYSDDWGANWKTAFPRGIANNATQVIAIKEGIILGADTYGGGVGFLAIDRTKRINPELSIDDYDGDFWLFADSDKRFIATRKWVDRNNGVYLMPYLVEYDDNSERSAYLAFSKDGYTWNNIFKSPHKGHYSGFHTITYGNGLIVGTYRNQIDPNYQIFIAKADL